MRHGDTVMTAKVKKMVLDPARYYDRRDILDEIAHEPIEFALDEALRAGLLARKRVRRSKTVSFKVDPVQVVALRKIATVKAIPYQTLIRQWIAAGIRRELRIGTCRRVPHLALPPRLTSPDASGRGRLTRSADVP